MSVTIPFELDGNEYISEVVSSKNIAANHIEHFIKINGDPACFVTFEQIDNSFCGSPCRNDVPICPYILNVDW